MTLSHPRKIFVNLPVEDLVKTKAFFEKLGFTYNPQFTDDKAACMILSDEAFVMLLTTPFFQSFTKREVGDPRTRTQGIYALSCDSRAEVDEILKVVTESGGSEAMPPMDHGFMYGRSFYDLDGHHWEVMWMDPTAAPAQP